MSCVFIATHTVSSDAVETKRSDSSLSSEQLTLTPPFKKQLWSFESGVDNGHELVIKGKALSKGVRALIRIDHPKSHHYFSRFNHEQLLSKGNFTIRIDLDNLKTGRSATFSSHKIRRIYYATIEGETELIDAKIAPKIKAPKELIGWDFGSQEKSGAWGFYPVSSGSRWENIGGVGLNKPSDVLLKGNLRARNRPYHDGLIRDGFEGIDSITLPIRNGFWRVRLWINDIGEWEYLPHPLNRSISINDQTIFAQDLTPEQWHDNYYFNQPDLSGVSSLNATSNRIIAERFWESFMIFRGTPIDAVVQVENEQLKINLESNVPAGKFLSGVIATPWNGGSEKTMEKFDQLRKQAFIEQWPILLSSEPWENDANLTVFGESETHVAHSELVSLKIKFDQHLGRLLSHQLPITEAIWLKEESILGRVGGQEKALTLRSYLKSFDPMTTDAKNGDIWYLLAKVHRAPHHTHNNISSVGELVFSKGSLNHTFIHMPVRLPQTPVPVGIYLDYAPHLSWFSNDLAIKQARCDYRFLKRFGLSGVAPALPTPSTEPESIMAFKKAIQAPLLEGLQPPLPAYTPLKRMVNQPLHEQISVLQNLKQSHPYTLWSLADEPGLFIKMDEQLNALNSQLADFLPTLRRYAQLNHNEHADVIENYSDVLINQGYGLNPSSFETLQKAGTRYYLYNLPNLRYSSGAYLWRSKARGFWQWHGRMPTAHPFDPTDGREDDVQFFLPNKQGCNFPIIRSDLVHMRSGINDLKWLFWLSQNANNDIHFAILKHQLEQAISLEYSKKSISNKDINLLISKIKKLAQSLPIER
ncbi:hypothetical protein [Marinomonas balearica]|uniref:hypothetical protein n=1 Tax=Marinomonas balearica TaxID=491947 RepID=UPI001061245D|nr:hypothetical protein [Marinomonas balearica]